MSDLRFWIPSVLFAAMTLEYALSHADRRPLGPVWIKAWRIFSFVIGVVSLTGAIALLLEPLMGMSPVTAALKLWCLPWLPFQFPARVIVLSLRSPAATES